MPDTVDKKWLDDKGAQTEFERLVSDGRNAELLDCETPLPTERAALHAAALIESQRERIAELEAREQWVRVADELPEPGKTVIAWTEEYPEITSAARYSAEDDEWYDLETVDRDGDWAILPHVSLWMPLPTPPTEGEG